MIDKQFSVYILGDLNFEDLVANIYFNDQIFAMISQEKGYENLEIQIYPPVNEEHWDFNFEEFDKAIHYAKTRLWELRRIDDEDISSSNQ